jgi:hypothetical protein
VLEEAGYTEEDLAGLVCSAASPFKHHLSMPHLPPTTSLPSRRDSLLASFLACDSPLNPVGFK